MYTIWLLKPILTTCMYYYIYIILKLKENLGNNYEMAFMDMLTLKGKYVKSIHENMLIYYYNTGTYKMQVHIPHTGRNG